jgi:insulysin
VHDAETVKSAAACSVNVGSMSDPTVAQGLVSRNVAMFLCHALILIRLAHFLEHMLFMGTEKYPVENEYSTFLNNHGGSSNAYTALENTVYFFDVQNEFFSGALDLFSSFFVCPLFTESATSREMSAVDNENTKNLQSDMWRDYQLMKHLSREDHPFHSFGTGNLRTLRDIPQTCGVNIRELLLKFHDTYYSANIMKVVLYGNESLDVLQAWAEEKFGAIVNKGVEVPSFSADVYPPEQMEKVVEVVPVRDVKSLDMYFLVPGIDREYRKKPMRYIRCVNVLCLMPPIFVSLP